MRAILKLDEVEPAGTFFCRCPLLVPWHAWDRRSRRVPASDSARMGCDGERQLRGLENDSAEKEVLLK